MKARTLAASLLVLQLAHGAVGQSPATSVSAPPASTPAGIPLDAPWKQAIFKFATEKLQHTAWGVQHYERDYLLATRLAAAEKMTIDTDVLFAAAFLHDVGAFDEWRKQGMDHTDRAAEVLPEMLTGFGFPTAKIEAVQEAARNHMYYSTGATRPEAVVLRDADTLDFLGAIGVARILSLTTRQKSWAADPATAARTLEGFSKDLPAKLATPSAKTMGAIRVAEMKAFLEALKAETEDGKAR